MHYVSFLKQIVSVMTSHFLQSNSHVLECFFVKMSTYFIIHTILTYTIPCNLCIKVIIIN